MTTITDKQRREVAARMRGYLPKDEDELSAAIVSVFIDRGMVEKNPAHTLADLIDRPTCTVESAERWETAGCGRGVDYELSCGHSVTLGECDELRFCPVCGAEVTE